VNRCECCRRDIREPVIHTIAGDFFPGWGMCRSCWRLVGRLMRGLIVSARFDFRCQPQLEQSIALYWLWQLCLGEAQLRFSWRSAA